MAKLNFIFVELNITNNNFNIIYNYFFFKDYDRENPVTRK